MFSLTTKAQEMQMGYRWDPQTLPSAATLNVCRADRLGLVFCSATGWELTDDRTQYSTTSKAASTKNKHFTCLENNVTWKKPEKLAKHNISHQINFLWLEQLRKTSVTHTDITWTQMRSWASLQVCRESLWAGCGRPQAQRSCLQGAAKQKQEVKLHI